MVGTKDGWISGEVVKAVSDDSHNNVQHNERTQEDEGDEDILSDRVSMDSVGHAEGHGDPLTKRELDALL